MPKDPSDEKDVLVEVRPGAGEEASIWVGDLYKMYNRYAEEIHGKLKKLNLLILIWVDTAKLFLQLNQKEFTPN